MIRCSTWVEPSKLIDNMLATIRTPSMNRPSVASSVPVRPHPSMLHPNRTDYEEVIGLKESDEKPE